MFTIDIVGLGLTEDTLTRGAMRLLEGGRVVLHTGRIGAANWLREKGIAFETLDALYDESEDFDEHAEAASEKVLEIAEQENVVYGVIDVRDESVRLLMEQAGGNVRLHPGVPVDGELGAFCTEGTYQACASDYENFQLRADQAALVREIDSAQLASEVKLKLLDVYPDESEAWVLSGGSLQRIELVDLDRMEGYDHRFCVWVPRCAKITDQQNFSFEDLVRIVKILQGRGGCPWDRAQTHESFRGDLIDEAYEVADAVDEDDPFAMADELGDVLFIVASHAELGRRTGDFDMTDVTTAICRKMIRRHPKVFGKKGADASGEWEHKKLEERGMSCYAELLRGITRSLPASKRAVKVQQKLKNFGLPGQTEAQWRSLLEESLLRMQQPQADFAEALGEALTALCGLCELHGTDPELALNAATGRVIERFAAAEAGDEWDALPSEEKQRRWENAQP